MHAKDRKTNNLFFPKRQNLTGWLFYDGENSLNIVFNVVQIESFEHSRYFIDFWSMQICLYNPKQFVNKATYNGNVSNVNKTVQYTSTNQFQLYISFYWTVISAVSILAIWLIWWFKNNGSISRDDQQHRDREK